MADRDRFQVLLVEDNIDDEMFSQRALARCEIPCDVTVRRDGESALRFLLDENPEAMDLIVLDYHLPKVEGLEVVKKLRRHPKTHLVPIVVFSGTEIGCLFDECFLAGANSCVKKPADANDYINTLVSVARYWLTINQTTPDKYRLKIGDYLSDSPNSTPSQDSTGANPPEMMGHIPGLSLGWV